MKSINVKYIKNIRNIIKKQENDELENFRKFWSLVQYQYFTNLWIEN